MNGTEWFQALHASIWTKTTPSRGFPNGMAIESRRLTDGEWAEAKSLMDACSFVYQMSNACMGFGCSISIGVMRPSTYPGVPNEIEWVACITKDHLPLSVCSLREIDERGPHLNDRTFFEDGWRAFTPYTHSDANKKNLREYSQDLPKPKDYYEY